MAQTLIGHGLNVSHEDFVGNDILYYLSVVAAKSLSRSEMHTLVQLFLCNYGSFFSRRTWIKLFTEMSVEYSEQEVDGTAKFTTFETFLVAGYELDETDNDVQIILALAGEAGARELYDFFEN